MFNWCNYPNIVFASLACCITLFGIVGSWVSPLAPVLAALILTLSVLVYVTLLLIDFFFRLRATRARYHVVREEIDRDEAVELQRAVLVFGASHGENAAAIRRVLDALEDDRPLSGDDFEALLELDTLWGEDDSPSAALRGLLPNEIAQLPTRVYGEGRGETLTSVDTPLCSICLSVFSVGDRLRTLPCLHGFHEACVDTWLKARGICPECRQFCGVDTAA